MARSIHSANTSSSRRFKAAISLARCARVLGRDIAKISISLPDELLSYLDQKVENRSALIETLLQQWRQQQEDLALAQACMLVDELKLGWGSEWQNAAIRDWEASGL